MFGRKYNQAHVDKLNGQIDKAHERITALEEVIRGNEDLTLEVKWLKALINDDEAICELLDAATQKQIVKREHVDIRQNMQVEQAHRMQQQDMDARAGFQMAGIYGLGQQNMVNLSLVTKNQELNLEYQKIAHKAAVEAEKQYWNS